MRGYSFGALMLLASLGVVMLLYLVVGIANEDLPGWTVLLLIGDIVMLPGLAGAIYLIVMDEDRLKTITEDLDQLRIAHRRSFEKELAMTKEKTKLLTKIDELETENADLRDRLHTWQENR